MRIKVQKFWLTDGTIVLTVRDHDVVTDAKRDRWNADTLRWDHGPYTGGRHVQTLERIHLPRATPKAEVRMTMRSLKMAVEARVLGAL